MHLPRTDRKNSSATLLALVVVAVLAAACSSVGDEPAVTVAGDTISQESLDQELEAITSNPEYLAGIEQSFQTPAQGTGEGTYDAGFVARLLTLRVYYELVEQELADRGIEITDDDLAASRERTLASLEGEDVFTAFPESYQERLVRQGALLSAIEAAFAGEASTEEDARAFYEDNQQAFETRCLAHILIGTNDEAQPTGELTRAEAEVRAVEVFDELEAGADFTEVASSDVSDDTVSAADGGDLGCVTRQANFDPTFLEAAFEAEVGEVTAPIETQFGYHLILVSSAEVPPFEEVEAEIDQILAQQESGQLDEFLRSATCETDIDVASRYGTWDTSACEAGGIGAVAPPEGPVTPTTLTPDGGVVPGVVPGADPDADPDAPGTDG